MTALHERSERAILVLGPRHSGKSVFSYLLFKSLRQMDNDSALIECDVFGPTFRAHSIGSPEEQQFIYPAPNWHKMAADVPLGTFEGHIDLLLFSVREKGALILDGLGKHSDKTDALLKRARYLAIVCKDQFGTESMTSDGYVQGGTPTHPFEFYDSRTANNFKVTTRLEDGISNVDIDNRIASVYGLSRQAIRDGSVNGIPDHALVVIGLIAEYIIKNWS